MNIALLSIVFISLCSTNATAKNIHIVVASESKQKIEAVAHAFAQTFWQDDIHITACSSSSGIPEQPIGKDVAQQGTLHRLHSLPQEIVDTADYVVAIENYIEQAADGNWFDAGLVLVQHKNELHYGITKETYFSHTYADLARSMSDPNLISERGLPITVGFVIAQQLHPRSVNAQDWHREKEFGGISRTQLLDQALFKLLHAQEIQYLKDQIVEYPDFPKPGILFSDFLPILSNPTSFNICINLLADYYRNTNISAVVGLESRGFILGAALAHKLGIGFVPVRKSGKLPGKTISVSYQKEYGSDTLVIAQSALQQNQHVLIIDDLIATGGSARAAIELVQKAGAHPVEFVSLLQIKELAQKAQLSIPAFNLID